MGSNPQSRVTSAFSVIAALILLLAGIFEFQRGGAGMAIMALMGMVCALIIAWHSRKAENQSGMSYLPWRARNN